MSQRHIIRLYELMGEVASMAAMAKRDELNGTADHEFISRLCMDANNAAQRLGPMVNRGNPKFEKPAAAATPAVVVSTKKPKVTERTEFWSCGKQWSLDPSLTTAQINKILKGVKSSGRSGDGKCTQQWDFYADGQKCSIWDYKGARWSAAGPKDKLDALGLTVMGN